MAPRAVAAFYNFINMAWRTVLPPSSSSSSSFSSSYCCSLHARSRVLANIQFCCLPLDINRTHRRRATAASSSSRLPSLLVSFIHSLQRRVQYQYRVTQVVWHKVLLTWICCLGYSRGPPAGGIPQILIFKTFGTEWMNSAFRV